jgi:hypothetical protein
MRRVVILQSCYIPWKGYFDLIRAADEFILYDDAQYTRNDWRNRNCIKTARGVEWLTIPVRSKGRHKQKIHETEVADRGWARQHWRSLELNYARAPHFARYRDTLASTYHSLEGEQMLSAINRRFLDVTCELLGIDTRITWSMDYTLAEGKTERVVQLCRDARATHCLCGPSARSYMEPQRFEEAGIALEYADYSGYPPYPQLHGPFVHEVSILDLLFNTGDEATRYMKGLA